MSPCSDGCSNCDRYRYSLFHAVFTTRAGGTPHTLNRLPVSTGALQALLSSPHHLAVIFQWSYTSHLRNKRTQKWKVVLQWNTPTYLPNPSFTILYFEIVFVSICDRYKANHTAKSKKKFFLIFRFIFIIRKYILCSVSVPHYTSYFYHNYYFSI